MTLLLPLVFLAILAAADNLPYNPTKLFTASNGSIVYIVDSISSNDGKTQLFSLDVGSGLSNTTAATNLKSLSSIPVTTSSEAVSLIQNADGSIVAIVGGCTNGGQSPMLSSISPGESDSWTQAGLQGEAAIDFLAAGSAFSARGDVLSNSSIYLFGGMCPMNNASSWITDATYSAAMLRFTQATTNQYQISTLAASGGPVAEAGLTMTPLPATSHSGVILQQQYVFIGGHTQSAFINMSQVAIFSVPQESWTFLPVQQPQPDRIDLAVRQSSEVEPRSGHTAVLSQDGTKIIVFGGWVGDTSTPAQPQLAILEVGSGFGGEGSWQWSLPSASGAGLTTGSGLFGHGAVLLPGNVMMVYGGYDIPALSSSSKRASLTPRTTPMFLNITSNQWVASYNLPANATPQKSSGDSSNSDTKQKIGLAVGLTIGLLILLALLVFYFWYVRRLRTRRQEVERGLTSRSSNGSYTHIEQPFLEKTSIDGRGGEMTALNSYWMDPHSISSQPLERSAATGAFMDVPSPTRGLRKGSTARNYQYHAAPRYDDKRVSRHSGNIHPIAESDNEDASSRVSAEGPTEHLTEAQRQLKAVEAILNANRTPEKRVVLNPLRSHPVSPEAAEINTGPDTGRISPTKTDDRTSSSLSEQSHRSILSDNSITRTMSTRTGALLAAAAAAHVRARVVEVEASTSSDSRSNTMSTNGRTSPVSRRTVARSSTNGSSAGAESRSGAYAESFRTARSTTTHEGDRLFTGPALDRDDPYRRALAANDSAIPYNIPGRRRQGIFGSLKKAIGVISPIAPRSGHDYNQLESTNSSPIKERHNPIEVSPRRTVSEGGALLRQKRGKQDWADPSWPPYRDDPDLGDWGEPLRTSTEKQEAEEEWNVEDAAEKRDVQVMFTVPKSRLRVVNADMERASLRSVSDPLSRSGSTREPTQNNSKAVREVQAAVEQLANALNDDKNKQL